MGGRDSVEEQMARRIVRFYHRIGLDARIAIAGTAGTALRPGDLSWHVHGIFG